ncbi:MAG: c-type cytochrome [Rhodospirillum sp.]|nr:c-type cytochrome [Rhodospirillum sp.]MCF8490824.1 c-type cytochrome [Rhodospirillum sp.]MCF8501705.1 c-type cytochrome [Rhodospirillum sp.]
MKNGFLAAGVIAAVAFASGSAFAEGDAAAGEKVSKKCIACHTFDEGGANKVGPNLFGVYEGPAAHKEDYKYSDSYTEMKEKGLTWTAENLAGYLKDPKGFLVENSGDAKAKTKMTFKLTKDDDVENIIAYLATLK